MTLVVAVADWAFVASGRRVGEYVCKPLTMVMLIATALRLDVSNHAVLVAFVIALVFSLIGDVFLMLPGERWFVFGLAAFLVGHLGYVVGLWLDGVSLGAFAIGLAVVVAAVAVIGRRILRGVAEGDDPALAKPVIAYIAVISLMVASAIGTRTRSSPGTAS
jgi:uncharacterized membrane protein YhhN